MSIEIDSRIARLAKRYKGLSRIAAAINDSYIYGIYPGNFPHLCEVLEKAKDHVKEQIKKTKEEIKRTKEQIELNEGLTVKELIPTDPLITDPLLEPDPEAGDTENAQQLRDKGIL